MHKFLKNSVLSDSKGILKSDSTLLLDNFNTMKIVGITSTLLEKFKYLM